MALMGAAKFLIFPSECYETFGLVTAEAFARETPVIASRLGVMSEIIRDRDTGLHFEVGNAEDLATTVRWPLATQRKCAKWVRPPARNISRNTRGGETTSC